MSLWDNVSRVVYQSELNRIDFGEKAQIFLKTLTIDKIKSVFDIVLEDIVVGDGNDVSLNVFLSSLDFMDAFSNPSSGELFSNPGGVLSMSIFPGKGVIEEYILNTNSYFFSNAHRNSDPLIVSRMKKLIYIHPNSTSDFLRFGRRYPEKYQVPNCIDAVVLFKKDIKEYEGYSDYLIESMF
jgi:hypothetical protein